MSDDVRAETRAMWEEAGPSWGRTADRFSVLNRPVTERLLELARLAPGRIVLELGAGPGDVGLAAAARVRPGGRVVISDVAAAMVDVARERVAAAGAEGVEVRRLDAESIDADTASFDAVVSRFGLMFTADPEAPFREARRVLRPGGRLAVAAWCGPEDNPWFAATTAELLEQGLSEPPPPGDRPGPFRFAAPGRLARLLDGAGFDDVEVAAFAFTAELEDWDDLWHLLSTNSNGIRRGLALTHEAGARALEDGLRRRFAPCARPDGSYPVPFRALLGAASA